MRRSIKFGVVLGLCSLVLAGCGRFDRAKAHLLGHSTICVDGVNYLQFSSGATVKYDRTGKISLCGN